MFTRKDSLSAPTRLRLFSHIRRESAASHYRVKTPLLTASRLGLAEHYLDATEFEDDTLEAMDINLSYLVADKRLIDEQISYNKRRYDKHGLYPRTPHIVYDADDHVEAISIFNPKFAALGTRISKTEVLSKGGEAMIKWEGEPHCLWKDGVEYGGDLFDIERNLARLGYIQKSTRLANGVTTTCEGLAKVFRSYGAKNVYVFPNSLMEEDYPEIRVERPKRVRLLWQGGFSHFEDFELPDASGVPLKSAMVNVFKRRPNIEFVVWGWFAKGIHGMVPAKNLTVIPWTDYAKYTIRLATIGHHINIAPLVDNEFNRCKSAIKWYESSAITKPAVTLAANVGPYKEIQDGITGFLYDSPQQFENKLVALIDDAKLRETTATAARDWCWDNRNARKTVPPLIEFYREIRNQTP